MKKTISKEEFASLKRGSVIIWRNNTHRVVQLGPADYEDGRSESITLPKMKNSQYDDAHTIYGYNDVCTKIRIASEEAQKSVLKFCNLEKDRLASIGQSWVDGLELQLKREIELRERLKGKPHGINLMPEKAFRSALAQLKRIQNRNEYQRR